MDPKFPQSEPEDIILPIKQANISQTKKTKNSFKKIPLLKFILFQIIIVAFLSITIDKIAGFFLIRSGYWKAFVPNITDVHKTNEYYFVEKTSSQGLRNQEVIIPKPKNAYRILTLGDSFTWGQGVDLKQSWPKVLENKLTGYPKRIEVINAGIWGASLTTETLACKIYADRFDADMIILAVYSTDDLLQEAVLSYQSKNDKFSALSSLVWPNLSKINKPYIAKLYYQYPGSVDDTQSRSRKEVQKKLAEDPLLIAKINPKIRNDFANGLISPPAVLSAISDPNLLIYMLNKEDYNLAISIMEKKLSEFKKECAKNRPTIVIYIPGNEMVSQKYHEYRKILGYNIDNRLLTFDFDQSLSKIVLQKGFLFTSLLKNFRSDGCEGCYFSWDSHFTEKGNARLTDALLPLVSDKIRAN